MQMFQERREVPRYSFSAPALIRCLPDGEVSDVSVLGLGIAGCRIEAPRRLTVHHEYELTLSPGAEEIVTNAVVVYWHRTGFAGLHFTSMSQEAKARLERLVDYISGTFTAS